jgi:hypothetical protein
MNTAKKLIKYKYVWGRSAFEIVGYTVPRKRFEFLKTYLNHIKQTTTTTTTTNARDM